MRKNIYAFFAILPVLAVVFGVLSFSGVLSDETFFYVSESLVGHPLGVLVLIGALILYIVDVWANPRVPRDKRWLWTVVFVVANVYAMPFYYWFYIR